MSEYTDQRAQDRGIKQGVKDENCGSSDEALLILKQQVRAGQSRKPS